MDAIKKRYKRHLSNCKKTLCALAIMCLWCSAGAQEQSQKLLQEQPQMQLQGQQTEQQQEQTDSIPEFDREMRQITFVPKGQWIAGVSVSYSQSNQDNYQFLIIESINGDSYQFKITPMVLYAFKNNLAAGGKIAYTRQRTRLNSANIKIASDQGYSVDNLYSISHTYSAMGAFRNYISIGSSTRFGIFNEVQLQLSGGQSKLCNGAGEQLSGTFEQTFSINIGLTPGLIMFLNNYSALEVNVGVLGFNYTHTKSTTDQIYIANRSVNTANFRINLFSVTFGVVFYI